jgi:hypothetical protein
MKPLPTVYIKWQSDIDPTTEPEDDIAFVFIQPTNGASRYQLSREAESSEKMTHPIDTTRPAKLADNDELRNIVNEQAREIASLRSALADNEQLRDSMASQIEAQQARIVELETALKPFTIDDPIGIPRFWWQDFKNARKVMKVTK